MQVKRWDNIRPLQREDQDFGRALIRFNQSIDDGTCFGAPPPIRHKLPRYKESDFRAATLKEAIESLTRARSQHEKGRVSAAEFAEIAARCQVTIDREVNS